MSHQAAITKYSNLIASALDGKEILIASDFDLSFDGKYQQGVFAVSEDKICVATDEKVILVDNISNIEKVCCAEYTGGGILEAYFAEGRRQLVRFTMRYIEQFSAIAEIINELILGSTPLINEKTFPKEKVCPKCGRPTRVGHVIENGKKMRVCKKSDCGAKFE